LALPPWPFGVDISGESKTIADRSRPTVSAGLPSRPGTCSDALPAVSLPLLAQSLRGDIGGQSGRVDLAARRHSADRIGSKIKAGTAGFAT
jgi:hypothetical protein